MKEKEKTYIDKSSFRYYCLSYQTGGWTTCHL